MTAHEPTAANLKHADPWRHDFDAGTETCIDKRGNVRTVPTASEEQVAERCRVLRERKQALYEQCLAAGLDVLHPLEGRNEDYYRQALASGKARLPGEAVMEPVLAWDEACGPCRKRRASRA